MTTVVFVICAYLIGSLSFAVIISKLFDLPDPRSFGSKNPGATNVLRTGKKLAAVLTLVGDAAKGWFAVFLAQKLGPFYGISDLGIAGVAVAVFVGHVYPVYFGFKGGKGVATALGILLALNIWLGLSVLATWLTAVYMWRVSSLSALISAVFAPAYAMIFLEAPAYRGAVLLLAVLLVWRHKSNIKNLFSGKEGSIGGESRPQDMPPE